ncbi:MAG: iron uptake porin, partial [Fischerella sp.]|nr:iron uptake porin [Fischerella sp.]
MSNILWKSLVVSPAVLGAALLVSTTAIAAPSSTASEQIKADLSAAEQEGTSVQTAFTASGIEVPQQPEILAQAQPQPQVEVNVLEQVNRYSNEGKAANNTQSQVTSVSQFSDVQPTDWAFQALQSLVERYGCIAGYPNGTYRGNRPMTRYEFAAGLNACLDRVNELIATATAELVTKEDLATLQRLQEEFSAELATLRGRVDTLEARTAELEANQFSTTTKLVGEAIFALTDSFGSDDDNNTVFQNRIRLDLQTSFTGKDVLHTRLATGNAQSLDIGVPGLSLIHI